MSKENALAPYTGGAMAAYERAEALEIENCNLKMENERLLALLDPNQRILSEKEKIKEFKRIIKWLKSLRLLIDVRVKTNKIGITLSRAIGSESYFYFSYEKGGKFCLDGNTIGWCGDMYWGDFIKLLILKNIDPKEFEKELLERLSKYL